MPDKDYEGYDLKEYLGIKKIKAEPAPAPDDIGEYEQGDLGYKVVYPDGYVSWSPKGVFEEAYQEVDGLTGDKIIDFVTEVLEK